MELSHGRVRQVQGLPVIMERGFHRLQERLQTIKELLSVPQQERRIVAAANGTVKAANYSSAAGNYVMIDHGGGLYTVYMHCSSLAVSEGTAVSAGQTIAYVGSTGISTGNHLHFGVSLNGSYVSPWSYLKG